MSDEIKKTVPVLSGHAVEEIFLRWSEWTSELGEAISRKNIDGFVGEIHAVLEARAGEAVAYVPVHPRNGPLWANTVPSLDNDRPQHYPVRELFFHPPIGDAAGKDEWQPIEPTQSQNHDHVRKLARLHPIASEETADLARPLPDKPW
jgi:hypothetical protein